MRFIPHTLVINDQGILKHHSSEDPEVAIILSAFSDVVEQIYEYNDMYKVHVSTLDLVFVSYM